MDPTDPYVCDPVNRTARDAWRMVEHQHVFLIQAMHPCWTPARVHPIKPTFAVVSRCLGLPEARRRRGACVAGRGREARGRHKARVL